ncbi:hypothetical protein EON63_16855 [archaeon]|nr:MAG: hypothetical protein EON63_16855 [archaeon]
MMYDAWSVQFTITVVPSTFTWLHRENQIVELPEDLSKLANLEILSISSNALTHLPSSITQLSKLVNMSMMPIYTFTRTCADTHSQYTQPLQTP